METDAGIEVEPGIWQRVATTRASVLLGSDWDDERLVNVELGSRDITPYVNSTRK